MAKLQLFFIDLSNGGKRMISLSVSKVIFVSGGTFSLLFSRSGFASFCLLISHLHQRHWRFHSGILYLITLLTVFSFLMSFSISELQYKTSSQEMKSLIIRRLLVAILKAVLFLT